MSSFRKIAYAFVMITLVVLLTGCGETDQSLSLALDDKGNYTGFSTIAESYTIKQAERDGCYVRVDSEPVSGQDKWDSFLQAASEGRDAGIRMMHIYDWDTEEQQGPYYTDLFYQDSYYHIFDSTARDQQDQAFLYLLTLNGTLPNAAKSSVVTVLTDDDSLTFEEVMWSMLSSSMEYKNSISSFRIVSL